MIIASLLLDFSSSVINYLLFDLIKLLRLIFVLCIHVTIYSSQHQTACICVVTFTKA